MAPLTLLCGANSAGKSSILQALLLLRQTLENPSDDPLLLNGAHVSLGDPTDVLHVRGGRRASGLTLSLDLRRQASRESYSGDRRSVHTDESCGLLVEYRRAGGRFVTQNSEFSHHVRRAAAPQLFADLGDGPPDLPVEEECAAVRFDRFCARDLPEAWDLSGLGPDALGRLYRRHGGDLAPDRLYTFSKFYPRGRLAFEHGSVLSPLIQWLRPLSAWIDQELPRADGAVNDDWLIRSHELSRFVDTGRFEFPACNDLVMSLQRRKTQTPVAARMATRTALRLQRRIARAVAPAAARLGEHEPAVVEGLHRVFELLPRRMVGPLRTRIAALEADLERRAGDALPVVEQSEDWAWREFGIVIGRAKAEQAFEVIEEALCTRLAYLGPLRQEARPFYRATTTSQDPRWVGRSGENLAFVLQHYGEHQIVGRFPPETSPEGRVWSPQRTEPESLPLVEGTSRWLAYLGVAAPGSLKLAPLVKGVSSIRMRVPGSSASCGLDGVGFGVCQVLPILVMGLISDAPGILLFEQPELHLHPSVQVRLADFFVGLALMGHQVLIETHSEHLINRMRVLRARDELGPPGLTEVLFFGPDDAGLRIEPIEIDADGNVVNWPAGFFDQSIETIRELALAQRLRRDESH